MSQERMLLEQLFFFLKLTALIAHISLCLVAGIQLKTKQMLVSVNVFKSRVPT